MNWYRIVRSISTVRVVYSYASDTGYGGYFVEHGKYVATEQWSADDAVKSSTWRELMAVYKVLGSFVSKLRGLRIKWYSDNGNVISIIACGSTKYHLQKLAMEVYHLCVDNNINLVMEWLPRDRNVLADAASRILDFNDWSLVKETFHWLNDLRGPHSFDRFATDYNKRVPLIYI